MKKEELEAKDAWDVMLKKLKEGVEAKNALEAAIKKRKEELELERDWEIALTMLKEGLDKHDWEVMLKKLKEELEKIAKITRINCMRYIYECSHDCCLLCKSECSSTCIGPCKIAVAFKKGGEEGQKILQKEINDICNNETWKKSIDDSVPCVKILCSLPETQFILKKTTLSK